jgi:hypothetical protein
VETPLPAGEFFVGMEYPILGDAMETTALSRSEKSPDHDSLFLASLILRDVNRTITDVQSIAVLLLRYALLGASITHNLIDLTVSREWLKGWARPFLCHRVHRDSEKKL